MRLGRWRRAARHLLEMLRLLLLLVVVVMMMLVLLLELLHVQRVLLLRVEELLRCCGLRLIHGTVGSGVGRGTRGTDRAVAVAVRSAGRRS